MAGSLDAMHAELAQAVAALRASTTDNAALSGAIDGLIQRADRLQATGAVLAARTRATSVLTLAVGLRRNVDAGAPIGAEIAALKATGVFPGPVDHALAALTPLGAGVPTMRGLGEGFDVLQAKLTLRADGGSAGGLARLESLFGLGAQSPDGDLLERLRALANDGRFAEAAKVLEASDAAYLGADWIAMVRARATAVIATQVILTHALRAVDVAYAMNDETAAQKPAAQKPTE